MFELDVLMPYYGDPSLLKRAVSSVRGMQGVDWRMVIVEDVHPQGPATEAAIRELGDERITYLRNDKNLGVAENTHKAMQMGTREHFVLMDYDDLMLPNYGTAVAALYARHPGSVAVQPGIEVVDENDLPYRPMPDRIKAWAGPINRDVEISGEAGAVGLLRGNWTYAPSICYRRSAARDLRLRSNAANTHDLARLVDLIMAGGSIAVGSEVAFRYRRHRTSTSSTGARTGVRFAEEREYFLAISKDLRAMGWNSAARAARVRLFSRLNAAAQLPGAVLGRDGAAVKALLGHAVG